MAIDGDINLGDPDNLFNSSGWVTPFSLGAVGHPAFITASVDEDLTLEALTLDDASMEPPLQLGPLSLDASWLTGEVGDAAPDLPYMTLAGTVLAGIIGSGDAQLEQLIASGDTGPGGDIDLAAITLDADGLNGALGQGALLWPGMDSDGTALQNGAGSGDVTFQLLGLDAAGSASVVGGAVLTMLAPTLSATALQGSVMTASLTLPLFEVDGNSMLSSIGSATVQLPSLLLTGLMEQALAAPVFTGVVLNTRNGAVTTYSAIAANSLCQFNGLTLAATPDGIVALTGDDDLGAPIAASVAGGVSDFGSAQFKRVLAGYVGYQAGGQLELTLITDGHHEYVYQLAPRNMDVQHASRVKFGRGVDGRYWQWRLANRDGAAFALDALTLDVAELHKRIG